MNKPGKKIIDAMREAALYAKYKAKAEDLLARGDACIVAGHKAEGRRLLRECRRYRALQRQYGTEH